MKTLLSAAAIGLALAAPIVHADPETAGEASFLNIGDPAPPLHISQWLKGDEFTSFEDNHVYVVEFWATWCGPCIAGMPHVSEIQEKYEDDVTVLGVNIWEREPEKVPGWMDERGDDLMHYTVAMQQDTKMADEWMSAAGENGIPTAFIIDADQRIAWIGHPMSMDEPLAKVVAGEWDSAKARRDRLKEKEAEMRAQREMELFQERAGDAMEQYRTSDDPDKKMDAVRTILDADPPARFAAAYTQVGFKILASDLEDMDGARAFLDQHKAHIWDDAMALNAMSWGILTDPEWDGHRDADTALMLAERADELTNSDDAMIIDTVARAHFLKAIELQRHAVENAPVSMQGDLEKTLEVYQEAYDEQG